MGPRQSATELHRLLALASARLVCVALGYSPTVSWLWRVLPWFVWHLVTAPLSPGFGKCSAGLCGTWLQPHCLLALASAPLVCVALGYSPTVSWLWQVLSWFVWHLVTAPPSPGFGECSPGLCGTWLEPHRLLALASVQLVCVALGYSPAVSWLWRVLP